MELAARMVKQLIEIMQTLAIPQAYHRPLVADGPILAFFAEDVGGRGDTADGGKCGVAQGALDLEDGLPRHALWLLRDGRVSPESSLSGGAVLAKADREAERGGKGLVSLSTRSADAPG
jgi:hypothetical protein